MAEEARTNYIVQIHAEFRDSTFSSTRNLNVFGSNHMNDIVSSSDQALFAFILAVLLNFLQLKYQGKAESPFETHPLTMLAAITTLSLYCLSYYATFRISSNHRQRPSSPSPRCTCFLRSSMAVFASLSLASIASVLLPYSLCPLLFSLSILFSLCRLLRSQLVQTIWGWLLKTAIDVMDKFCHQPRQQERSRIRRLSVELPRTLSQHSAGDQLHILHV